MIQKTISKLLASMEPKPIPYEPAEVIDVIFKVERMLETAELPSHIDAADRLFSNMLHRYAFKPAELNSPLILGMQDRINIRRHEFHSQLNNLHGVAA